MQNKLASNLWSELENKEAQRVLKKRARLLASRKAFIQISDHQSLLIFLLNEEKYAVFYNNIEKIIPFQPVITIPQIDPIIYGLIYYEGEIWPVIDPRIILNTKSKEQASHNYFLLFRHQQERLALLIDDVQGHENYDPKTSLTVLERPDALCEKFIEGVYNSDKSLINVIELFQFIRNYAFSENQRGKS